MALTGGLAAAGFALLALVAAYVAFRHPQLVGPLVALLLPAGAYSDVFGVELSALEAVVGGSALGYAARLATGAANRRLVPVQWAFVVFVVCTGLSILGPADTSGQVREVCFWAALCLVFHAVTSELAARRGSSLLLVGLAFALLFESAYALYEYVDRWSDRFSLGNGAIVFPLPRGTLDHPNALGQFLVLAGFIAIALALAERGMVRRVGFLAVIGAMLALPVTFSRASWIACAAGAAVFLLDRRARVPVLVGSTIVATIAAALALVLGGAIGERITSLFTAGVSGIANFRLELVDRAVRAIAEHPLTGPGFFEELGVYAGRPDLVTHPHNLFLGIAVFFGIPAAVAFAAVVALAFDTVLRQLRASVERHRPAVGGLAFLVALLVNGLFEYPFWNGTLATLIVLGIAVAATRSEPEPLDLQAEFT